jgi:metal-sulfur cluster biosynthetic enzyme
MDADVDFQNLLGTIIEPATQLPLSQLKMVKSVSIDGDQVSVQIELPTPAYAWTNLLTGLIETAAKTNL